MLEEEKRSQNIAKYFDDDSDDDYQQSHTNYDVKYRVICVQFFFKHLN